MFPSDIFNLWDWIDDFLDSLADFFIRLYEILILMINQVSITAEQINTIDFTNTVFHQYLGYFHYIVGTPNYIFFTTIILISAGFSLFSVTLKMISLIKSLLPW